MNNSGLTEEELKLIALKLKADGLVRIATVIPSRCYLNKLIQIVGTITKKPDTVEFDRYNIRRYLLFEEEINDIVKEFVETLEKHSDQINTNTLYKNLRSLKIKQSEMSLYDRLMKKLGLSTSSGTYSHHLNLIQLKTNNYGKSKNIITHELLHFASTVRQGIMTFSGFEQVNELTGVMIGRGINEGATEFLNCVLFGYPLQNASYKELAYIVRGIANLIGTDKFMELYFNNDLKKLEEEISKYSSKEVARTLIIGLDRLYDLKYEELINKPLSVAKELEENLISLVANLNLKKQKELLEHHEISKEQYEKDSLEFAYLYDLGITIEKRNNQGQTKPLYTIGIRNDGIVLTEKEYLEIINDMLNKVQNPESNKDEKTNEIMKIVLDKKSDRRKIIEKADNLFGTMTRVTDLYGNSLDNVFFNYKRFAEQIEKACEEGIEDVTIYDKEDKPHIVSLPTAIIMKGTILKSCEEDYLIKESTSDEHEEELKEMLEEKDNEPKNRTNESDMKNIA